MSPRMLREVEDADIDVFYEDQRDPEANAMLAYEGMAPADQRIFLAAAGSLRSVAAARADRDAYRAKWAKNRADSTVVHRTVVREGRVAGYVTCFYRFGEREVGYWIGREHWGKGLATDALRELVEIVTTRPLVARVAKHNLASRRVVEKCGFVVQGEDKYTPVPGGPEVHEWILRLP